MQYALIVLLLIQAVLFYSTLHLGGTINSMRENSMDILNERTANRRSYLQNETLYRWMNVTDTLHTISGRVDAKITERGGDAAQVLADQQLQEELLTQCAPDMVELLRRSLVTDVFLVFSGEQTGEKWVSLYLRDHDPRSSPSDNSDILAERGPAKLIREMGISMDSWWEPGMLLDGGERTAAFLQPLEAATQYPELWGSDLGRWSTAFSLTQNDLPVMTYTVPIRAADGTVIGVMGTGVTLDYLRSFIPNGELAEGNGGSYLLATRQSSKAPYDIVLTSGAAYTRLFGEGQSTLQPEEEPKRGNVWRILERGRGGERIYASIQPLRFYNSNTPFSQEEWALVALTDAGTLFEYASSIQMMVLLSLLGSLLVSLVVVGFLSRAFTKPISQLISRLRKSDYTKPVSLNRVDVQEIDELSGAIEAMSLNVFESSKRLTKIIRMSGISLGAFEYHDDMETVYCTHGALELLKVESDDQEEGAYYISKELFQKQMDALSEHLEEEQDGGNTKVFRIGTAKEGYRWVRLRQVKEETGAFGVLADATQEMFERRKIERERDYDLLTSLLNRRAFYASMQRLFQSKKELRTAALVMLDLDNLKYINDTYGHDCGDMYIRTAANIVRPFSSAGAVVARMSGDEFLLFFWGYDDREGVQRKLRQLKSGFTSETMPLPDGGTIKIRASAGIAWYPQDAESFEQLLQYADFAMYSIKNTAKGEFGEFQRESYNRDSYLLNCKEELNRLIEENLMDYHFQPIVDATTGEIFAYEALMRTCLSTLKSPLEILSLARSQSKLYQIERLTWFGVLAAYRREQQRIGERHIFLNSIPNQSVTDEDFMELERLYGDLLSHVVVEFTEEERTDPETTRKKQDYARRWKSKLALDDFGTGYNGEATLLFMTPDFLKIDMSIVRGVDADEGRRIMIANILSYAKKRDIKVIAEGVETPAELHVLQSLGVDYLQGYLLGKPSAQPQELPAEIQGLMLNGPGADLQ